MNNRLTALIFTIITVSGFGLQAQSYPYGFSFEFPGESVEEFTYYPVSVFNYKDQIWEEAADLAINNCIYSKGLSCEYVSDHQEISLQLIPNGTIYTLPDIFNQHYSLIPDTENDSIRTKGLTVIYRTSQVTYSK